MVIEYIELLIISSVEWTCNYLNTIRVVIEFTQRDLYEKNNF
jgi:hypothetical protein